MNALEREFVVRNAVLGLLEVERELRYPSFNPVIKAQRNRVKLVRESLEALLE